MLLLDEPTGPLDPESTGMVEEVLRERLNGGTSIIIVTHDAAQAERLADQRLVMRDGRLIPA